MAQNPQKIIITRSVPITKEPAAGAVEPSEGATALPERISTYTEVPSKSSSASYDKEVMFLTFYNTLISDVQTRLKMRIPVAVIVGLFFLFQNIAVFALLGFGLFAKTEYDLRGVLALVIPTTIGTTAYAVKEIVQLLFKDVAYQDYFGILSAEIRKQTEKFVSDSKINETNPKPTEYN